MDELTNQPTPQPAQPAAAPVKARFCTSCGSAADADASFCTNCGENLYVMQTASQPVVQPAVEPAAEPAVQPAAELVAQPVVEPAVQPVVEQPAAQPELAPVAEPIAQPAAAPVAEPVAQPAAAPVAMPVAEPAAQPTFEQPAAPQQPFMGGDAPQMPFAGAASTNANFGQPAKQGGTSVLVCGILAIILGFFIPLAGIILGIVAVVQSKKWAGVSKVKTGRICGIAGIIVSVISFILSLVLGVFSVMSYVDDSSESSISTSPSLSAPSFIDDESEIRYLIETRFDAIENGDYSAMSEIANVAGAGFEQALEVSMEDCGFTPMEYAEAITDGFTYEIVFVNFDEESGIATVGINVDYKDIFDVIATFQDSLSEFEESGRAATMSETEVLHEIGDLFLGAIDSTPVVYEANYALIDFERVDGEWVIDEDSWDFEIDYMFNVI